MRTLARLLGLVGVLTTACHRSAEPVAARVPSTDVLRVPPSTPADASRAVASPDVTIPADAAHAETTVPLPTATASAIAAALRAASARAQPPDDAMFCGGSAGDPCVRTLRSCRTRAIAVVEHELSALVAPVSQSTACAIRSRVRRALAVLANDSMQAIFPDTSDSETGYCSCALPAVAVPPALHTWITSLASICSTDSECTVTMPTSFHVRSDEEFRSTGHAFPAGTRVEVMASGALLRGRGRSFYVSLADGSTGWIFLDPARVPVSCHPAEGCGERSNTSGPPRSSDTDDSQP